LLKLQNHSPYLAHLVCFSQVTITLYVYPLLYAGLPKEMMAASDALLKSEVE